MVKYQKLFIRRAAALTALGIALLMFGHAAHAQTTQGGLRGVVTDQLDAAVVGATVTATDAAGATTTAVSDSTGAYNIPALAPGVYKVRVSAESFQPTDTEGVEVAAGQRTQLNLKLFAALENQEVTVTEQSALSTDLARNRTSIVLRGEALEALPDDAEDLGAVLRAMAGPGAGMSGSQFLVDGYSAGGPPPKETIKEIRLNENPFSAEYDKFGFGRIEIITKTGTDKLRGSLFMNFNDEALNARNPFAANRAPFQAK